MQSNDQQQELHSQRPEAGELSRRDLFRGLKLSRGAALAGAAGAATLAMASRAAAEQTFKIKPDFLLKVFMRGGADGLSVLCPYADPGYIANRNATRLYAPGTGPSLDHEVIPLAGSIPNLNGGGSTIFGLPKGLQALEQIYTDGKLAFVHAVANVADNMLTPQGTFIAGAQSHFAAQDIMEKGANAGLPLPSDGWIARHLKTKMNHLLVPRLFRAMSYRPIQSTSLVGTLVATPVTDPENYELPDFLGIGTARRNLLRTLYHGYGAPLDDAFDITDEAIDVLNSVDFNPPSGPTYPSTPFAQELKNVARMAKTTDVESVTVDIGGWDTHTQQGVYAGGTLHGRFVELAEGLRAFYDEMKNQPRQWVVLVVTEFGRTVVENSNAGTDHGKGGVAMVMGKSVNGGQLYGSWPGLGPGQLDDNDLAVTTDIRNVFQEIVDKALVNPNPTPVFRSVDAGYAANQLGLM